MRSLVRVAMVSTPLLMAACGNSTPQPLPSPTPVPTPEVTTANVYILPGAVDLGRNAFGDEPLVIYRGEQMRWRNVDGLEHNIVTDTRPFPEFATTGLLAPDGERSFLMNTVGATTLHCTIHPQMTGKLIVQDR